MRAGRPSLTARWVAAHRVRLERRRPSTPTGDVAGERRLYRDLSGVFAVPLGRPTGMAERTAFVDNEVARAIGHGVEQVVLLGAGHDGRPLRFGGGPTRWFEIDFPSTQADKQRRLSALGVEPDAVTYIGQDLMASHAEEDLGEALAAAGHDRARPSLFVCEGLFAYLSLEVLASLCTTLRARAAAGSVLVATLLVVPEEGSRGRALRDLVDLVLRVIGERRQSEFYPGDAQKLMVVTGWHVARSQVSTPSRLAQGSHLLVLAAEPDPEWPRS
jgi:methyltransferase (TIGR00027 family)